MEDRQFLIRRIRDMQASRYGMIVYLLLVCAAIPAPLMGFDFPGYVTMRGKIIDADTLKPIEGAVVWAMWDKCWAGVGAGNLCNVYKVKEVLTDANGEWSITGPAGTSDPSLARMIISVVFNWIKPPRLGYYKPGYFPFLARIPGGDFIARAYVDRSKDLEGILLSRMGNTKEELARYMAQWDKDRCKRLIPVKDPERKLRELDFDFQYPPNVICVRNIKDSKLMRSYTIIGLKRAVTPEEKEKAMGLGMNGLYPDAYQPLLRKALNY